MPVGPMPKAGGPSNRMPAAPSTSRSRARRTALYYAADSASYRSGRATAKDHWGNKRPLFVSNQSFDTNNAEQRRRGTRMALFSEAVVAQALRSKPVEITLRFSPGNTTINMKSK